MKPIGLPELPALRKAALSWLSFEPLASVKYGYCVLSVTHGRKTPMYWLRRCTPASRSFLSKPEEIVKHLFADVICRDE